MTTNDERGRSDDFIEGGRWTPVRYKVKAQHNEGVADFVVVTRNSREKAVAIAALYFSQTWPNLHLLDIFLEASGVAEEARTEYGSLYPPPGNPNNEIFDPVEWM